ncbi:MAG: hypothetical protein ACRC11_19775 [Xenococcaceae cyanobacterium]
MKTAKNLYGRGRYVQAQHIKATSSLNLINKNQAQISPIARKSGNLTLEHPVAECQIAFNNTNFIDTLPYLSDMATNKFEETPYFIYDPLLSRLYHAEPNIGSVFNNSDLQIKLVFLPHISNNYGNNYQYWVSAIEVSYGEILTGFPFVSRRPIALLPGTVDRFNSSGIYQESIAIYPISDENDTYEGKDKTNLPVMPCCWATEPGAIALSSGDYLAAKEIYIPAVLTDFSYELIPSENHDEVNFSDYIPITGNKDPELFYDRHDLGTVLNPYNKEHGIVFQDASLPTLNAIAGKEHETEIAIDANFKEIIWQFPGVLLK